MNPHEHRPSAPDVMPPIIRDREVEEQAPKLTRRRLLGVLGGSAATLVGGSLLSPWSARAETVTQPSNPNQPTQEELERAKTKAEIADLEANTKLTDEETRLRQIERKKIERELDPPLIDRLGKWGATLTLPAGVAVAATGIARHFKNKKAERKAEGERLRLDAERQRADEDQKYRDIRNSIAIRRQAFRQEAIKATNDPPPDSEDLMSAIADLGDFATNPRFAEKVFQYGATYFRARAKRQIRPAWMSKKQKVRLDYLMEYEIQADRELLRIVEATLPHLARVNANGEEVLPQLRGAGLNQMRFMRRNLERVDFDGAYLEDLTIVGSLAGSVFKLTRLNGSTFGEPDEPCDLRDAKLGGAEMKNATLAHVIVNNNTELPKGILGDPRATYNWDGFIFDGMTQKQVDTMKAETEAARAKFIEEHPELKSTHPRRVRKRLGKRLASLFS